MTSGPEHSSKGGGTSLPSLFLLDSPFWRAAAALPPMIYDVKYLESGIEKKTSKLPAFFRQESHGWQKARKNKA